jgi:hypothetical protein
MTIRQRTEQATAMGLAAASALHLAWAAGSTFPVSSSRELAELVVGTEEMPGPVACAAAAGALAISATSVAMRGPWARRIASITAAALLLRGAGGLAVGALHLGRATEQFRTWDRRLYSPLCIALGGGAALAASAAD